MKLPLAAVPEPDASLEPDGFVVVVDPGDRIHFLDWGGPPSETDDRPGVVLVHGLGQTAWIWAPVARRLGGPAGPVRTVAMDLRGHGLSDAPTDDGAYDLDVLAEDTVAVAEGSGLAAGADTRVMLAGHGFGAIVAAAAAVALGDRCARLILVDGGWETLETTTGIDVEEFLRTLDEPPEVMASLPAFLADRTGFDPTTWDEDQDRAARATVVETHAGRVVPATRPHALVACVRTMFRYDPIGTLTAVTAPITALATSDDETGTRSRALDAASDARRHAGRTPIDGVSFPHVGHNLMRYRPREVAAAILGNSGG